VWGQNYRGALTVGGTVVKTPKKVTLPAGEAVAMAVVGSSGQEVLGQSVDGQHMVVLTRTSTRFQRDRRVVLLGRSCVGASGCQGVRV
jgi:hypothetical protein